MFVQSNANQMKELRNRIYNFLFDPPADTKKDKHSSKIVEHDHHLQFLETCRQLHLEALKIAWTRPLQFKVRASVPQLEKSMTVLSKVQKEAITGFVFPNADTFLDTIRYLQQRGIMAQSLLIHITKESVYENRPDYWYDESQDFRRGHYGTIIGEKRDVMWEITLADILEKNLNLQLLEFKAQLPDEAPWNDWINEVSRLTEKEVHNLNKDLEMHLTVQSMEHTFITRDGIEVGLGDLAHGDAQIGFARFENAGRRTT